MPRLISISSLFTSAGISLLLAGVPACNERHSDCMQGDPTCDSSQPPPMMKKPPPRMPGNDDDTVYTLGMGGDPFDPANKDSNGVKNDDGGALVIDPGKVMINDRPLIWVANSQEGTVSKIDTRTMTELARYRTGPKGPANDPSRTTVGLNGDVVVANRAGAGATHIANDLATCVDKNMNGKIDTSTGPGDVKAWGEDECVLWYIDLPEGSYPRTAVFDAQYGIDGELSTTVYIGTYSTHVLYRIDAKTGKILKEINLGNVMCYGGAIDKNGVIWIRDAQGTLAFVDVNHGDMVGQTEERPPCAYGIAVDPQGRVWTSGFGNFGGGHCVSRFTPDAMDIRKGKWDSVELPGASFPRGLAVDDKKTVWIADTSYGVFAVDTDTLMVKHSIRMGSQNDFVGMAIDFDGMVWAINEGDSHAYRIDPTDVMNPKSVQVGQHPYTYSDMTGFQLRNAAAPTGIFRHTFQGCNAQAKWNDISWKADFEGGTSVQISARTGKDAKDLASKPWTVVAKSPPDNPPVSLAALGAEQVAPLLQVEVHLHTIHPAFSPRLTQLKIGSSCNILK